MYFFTEYGNNIILPDIESVCVCVIEGERTEWEANLLTSSKEWNHEDEDNEEEEEAKTEILSIVIFFPVIYWI